MSIHRQHPIAADAQECNSLAYALRCDREDPLASLRSEFFIPSKKDLSSGKSVRQVIPTLEYLKDTDVYELNDVVKTAADAADRDKNPVEDEASIYLCGNSLGLQPRRTADLVQEHLSTWASKGVSGHFTNMQDSSLPAWLDMDDDVAALMAPIVGAEPSEVAVMETLTANLHFMMASFYQPTKDRYKIILEGKAFPSDHYAVLSQMQYHDLDPADAMVILESSDPHVPTLETAYILDIIDRHSETAALILLPGIQYFTGQLFDIKMITQHAHSYSIVIGWDLAHAAGNTELKLHEWDVDFAVWCNYKYLNSGPGAVASLFVHERHGQVDLATVKGGSGGYRRRLAGWWGGNKNVRFEMTDKFVPIPGAAGFQLGNPCALALTAVRASLEVFAMTSIRAIRQKSIWLTNYLEDLLASANGAHYRIITPRSSNERGAQLSICVHPESMEAILARLTKAGVVVDERKPDVIRVAPAPLYNTFVDVFNFARIFREACSEAKAVH